MNAMVREAAEALEVLHDLPFQMVQSEIKTRLMFHPEGRIPEKEIDFLIDLAGSAASPSAIFKSSQVNQKTRDSVQIDGVRFRRPLLRVNLDRVQRVFTYAVTCGKEFDRLYIPAGRSHLDYALGVIKEMVLNEVTHYLRSYVARRFNLDFLWQLNPGYLQAWPVADRKLLFYLLGDAKKSIGVDLVDDYSLDPTYSDCGLFYYAEMEFEACQVCKQDPCMGRRAPYSEILATKYANKARRPCGSRVLAVDTA